MARPGSISQRQVADVGIVATPTVSTVSHHRRRSCSWYWRAVGALGTTTASATNARLALQTLSLGAFSLGPFMQQLLAESN
jgi:hypothetical protein